ncbi:MAG: heavy metal translocating P-type ATPase metal-binding domain-containing protein, partial [Woeseiaceae bacterium]
MLTSTKVSCPAGQDTGTCFHCALPVPTDCNITVEIEGESRPVCCPGCKAVAELICDSGMSRYYTMRDA